MMSAIKATKSTMKRIYECGFDRVGFDASMADYGYTTRDHKGDKYNRGGYIEIIDSETGEVVDYAKPYVAKYEGETYGDVITSEMESIFNCGKVWFSTCLDEVDY